MIESPEIDDFLIAEPTASAFDIIRQRRRTWLTTRGASQTSGPETASVFNEGVFLGDITVLRGIDLASLRRLEYLEPRVAGARYGRSYPVTRGAILVQYR